MKTPRLLLLIILLLPLTIGGCGNKGPLYNPEPEQKNN
ncbi:LPS translocon maturation chaperone LptM [Thiolapillus sp.]